MEGKIQISRQDNPIFLPLAVGSLQPANPSPPRGFRALSGIRKNGVLPAFRPASPARGRSMVSEALPPPGGDSSPCSRFMEHEREPRAHRKAQGSAGNVRCSIDQKGVIEMLRTRTSPWAGLAP